jgi:DNA polymerase II small subunit/DNA polymerase delta subunit B
MFNFAYRLLSFLYGIVYKSFVSKEEISMGEFQKNTVTELEDLLKRMTSVIEKLQKKITEEKDLNREKKLQSLAEQGVALSMALLDINNNRIGDSSLSAQDKASIVKVFSNANKWVSLVSQLS